ncbi:hypothetical protein X801_03598 [Opisthorchis viverrini]|uniref:Uncharacterized protein n=1 Tax=Opisthorchis viverrini TaxID=6198 RepID=A0A1S8X1D6_OPIVI|nr:hypothetical protein X801_03598 [Opisthorchis viverrini]
MATSVEYTGVLGGTRVTFTYAHPANLKFMVCVTPIEYYVGESRGCTFLSVKRVRTLQKTAAVVSNHWSWAQYFGITFITALILGLTIPIVFLVILIWACRRRHHNMNSPYTDNKLFSTNLWYYIGGKEIHDDPTGFRGASSLIRSNKHCNTSSGAGTLRNNTQIVPDVMDLPDVVIPGGRVVSFNYSGNTLGPGGTLRHMSQTNNQLMQSTNCFNTGLTMGTVSSQSSGTPATTVGRSGPDGHVLFLYVN